MNSRVQLALNVVDLDSATKFYSQLFNTEPHKVRPGYVNFAIDDPPLKLVLLENSKPDETLNHLGVEFANGEALQLASSSLTSRGLQTRESSNETCCHAVQDKVYVTAPEVPIGMWEFYTVIDDEGSGANDTDSVCCVTSDNSKANGSAQNTCCA